MAPGTAPGLAKRIAPGGGINSGRSLITPEDQLNDRAARLVGPAHREQRMFVQFDAWTDPTIFGWLEKHGNVLTPAAQRLFVVGRPKFTLGHLNCGFKLLTGVPLDRAVRYAAGDGYAIPVQCSKETVAFLTANDTSVKQLIHDLADYLHKIFSRHFRQDRTKPPSRNLKLAFIQFAEGKLRISNAGREWMNAEPDSAYFFTFAEFCIQASFYKANPGPAWWLQLGCMFAALQDVYCLRYHRRDALRAVADYGDLWYDSRRPIPDKLLLDYVESVQRRDGTLEKLVERVTWNAFWYFFDDVL
jgi:hypothetical protein